MLINISKNSEHELKHKSRPWMTLKNVQIKLDSCFIAGSPFSKSIVFLGWYWGGYNYISLPATAILGSYCQQRKIRKFLGPRSLPPYFLGQIRTSRWKEERQFWNNLNINSTGRPVDSEGRLSVGDSATMKQSVNFIIIWWCTSHTRLLLLLFFLFC